MKKDNKNFLLDLLITPTPTSDEGRGIEVFKKKMKETSEFLFQDNFNNCVFRKGDPDGKKVMISGHIDELGFIVTHITDGGFCNISCLSGEDRRVLPGSRLQVLTSNGTSYLGAISYKPIHVQEEEEYEKVVKVSDLLLDLGCKNREEVESLGISVGSLCVFQRGLENLDWGPSGDFILSEATDDKIGVYITEEVLSRLKNEDLKGVNLIGAAMAQEETGLRGAGVVASRVNPDISIDIDVTPSTEDELGISKARYGDVKLGKGVVIEFGPGKSRRIAEKLIRIAKEKEIPYQIGVSRAGGTNTSRIQERSLDCETLLLSIPNRSMHTPVEVVCWTDVEACIELIVEYIKGGDL